VKGRIRRETDDDEGLATFFVPLLAQKRSILQQNLLKICSLP